jgi:hypothetical protein
LKVLKVGLHREKDFSAKVLKSLNNWSELRTMLMLNDGTPRKGKPGSAVQPNLSRVVLDPDRRQKIGPLSMA